MLELVTSARSPFFQHFALLELDVFSLDDALALLETGRPSALAPPRATPSGLLRFGA